MLLSQVLLSPGTVKFRYNGHLAAKLSVDLTSKVCATIGGQYVRYFSVVEKKLVQSAGSIDCSVLCTWYGSKVSAEAVQDGENVALAFGVGYCDEVYKDELKWTVAPFTVTNRPAYSLAIIYLKFCTCHRN